MLLLGSCIFCHFVLYFRFFLSFQLILPSSKSLSPFFFPFFFSFFSLLGWFERISRDWCYGALISPIWLTTSPRNTDYCYNSWREQWSRNDMIIIYRLQVQYWLQVNNNTGTLNTCTRLRLMEPEQATQVYYIKDVVRSSL